MTTATVTVWGQEIDPGLIDSAVLRRILKKYETGSMCIIRDKYDKYSEYTDYSGCCRAWNMDGALDG